jgi:hypothetical protein
MGKSIDFLTGERKEEGDNMSTKQVPQQYTMADSVEMKCGECDCVVFIPAIQFRKISKIVTGESKDMIIPIEIYVCGDCGEINTELYMESMKQVGVK